jgi:hypothetical protein
MQSAKKRKPIDRIDSDAFQAVAVAVFFSFFWVISHTAVLA